MSVGLAALAALAAPAADAASLKSALLPPRPGLAVTGGGGEDDGGEGVSGATGQSSPSGLLPAPAAWVSRLQLDLARLGFFAGPDTGVYGPVTTSAVRRFQAANGLAADGRWGPASQALLVRRLGTAGAATPPVSSAALPPPAAWVSRLQTELHALGYFEGPVTGVYGPLTTAAARAFQAANGLVADGVWGPASRAALASRLANRG